MVTRTAQDGAPAVFQPNPTCYNVLGRKDYRATGGMQTDFRMVSGSAHCCIARTAAIGHVILCSVRSAGVPSRAL
jgi:hypothetical protein